MSLDTFLHNLHFNTEKVTPPNWEADWDDKPFSYKLYRGLPTIPLCPEIPLTLENLEASQKPDLREIGHFLWYVFGLTQCCQLTMSSDFIEQEIAFIQSYRRFAPSGGGLYPNELYMYLKIDHLPTGVYHYDVAHHRLVLLREGNFDSYLARSLGDRCDTSVCFGLVFVSTMFWKNFFKYNNFSYRLQGLDAGVLIGQLQEVAKRFDFTSGVYFQFLDRAINHLLGLSAQEESAYAIIPLSVKHTTTWFHNGDDAMNKDISATELCQELPNIHHDHYVRSRKITEYPMLIQMNEASLFESTQSFQKIRRKQNMNCDGQAMVLAKGEKVSYDFAAACRKRYSPEMDFVNEKINRKQVTNLLHETMASFAYQNDLDETHKELTDCVSLNVCLSGVEGIPDGAYSYDSANHMLRQIFLGDHRLSLQNGMTMHNVNLFQVPICLHVLGDKDHLKTTLGYRGYRIQQMAAGILVQKLLLVASSMGLGGHPLLGFDANLCDEIYRADSQGKTSLIQIPIGFYRPRSWLKGSLHS
ncbi:SagB family peptide dehydrogenase [Bacillus sp. DX1.1]|uniref:SagB family peptide dehydrogenase n=1 Tax=unclassified Bacillus (in: firmicutes) TaxID=185979 RepID=UPI00256FD26C|nr:MULTISPECIES: SagB family peptide dehydrogenase [unclassified Bacillus (in: firmicutes)]MDM5155094.1 SagB family peptide dehydrogenase [Bacillus sp. DX1.1]WJE83951.1 SagB family peptide dehydrogenase [Bacillus sp. DX3.1]